PSFRNLDHAGLLPGPLGLPDLARHLPVGARLLDLAGHLPSAFGLLNLARHLPAALGLLDLVGLGCRRQGGGDEGERREGHAHGASSEVAQALGWLRACGPGSARPAGAAIMLSTCLTPAESSIASTRREPRCRGSSEQGRANRP